MLLNNVETAFDILFMMAAQKMLCNQPSIHESLSNFSTISWLYCGTIFRIK